ncbi:uncharacterized protein N7484_008257 [Penicillium longicatenatum]|uniref:uncharacterized protein n=1 Tax=Penicillium longicatenatum TaxID=1561947 RepID=UPI002546A9E4|nr:uncharacterized protein N7484_008257 [Penicillium longicatenatum]KAJ5634944.1 hypothetical protein N7484_008257 [Penicillium longicatenatum]
MHPARENHQRPCTVWMAEPPPSGSLETSRASLSEATSDACDTTTVAANNCLIPAVRVQLMPHGREHHKRSPTVLTDETWDRLLNPSCPFSWKPTFGASDTNAVTAATIAYSSTRAQLVLTGLSAPKVLPMAKDPIE